MRPWLSYNDTDKQYLGVFYVDNVRATTGQIETVVLGYDKVYSMMNLAQEDLSVGVYTTVRTFLVALFGACGVTSYNIHTAIDSLPVGNYYLLQGRVGVTLQALMDAFEITFYSDRAGTIQVVPLGVDSTATSQTLNDGDQIFAANYQKELSKTFAKVACNYYKHSASAVGPILTLTGYKSEGQGRVKYDAYPVLRGCYAECKSYYGYNLNNFHGITFDRTQCLLEFGDTERYDITVYGELIETAKDDYIQTVTLPTGTIGVGTLTMDSMFIQGATQAQARATAKATSLSKGNLTIEMEARGNADIPLRGPVTLVDDIDKLYGTGWLLLQKFNYNGALSATIGLFVPDGIQDEGVV